MQIAAKIVGVSCHALNKSLDFIVFYYITSCNFVFKKTFLIFSTMISSKIVIGYLGSVHAPGLGLCTHVTFKYSG